MEEITQIYKDTQQGMKEYLEFNQIECPETERELEQITQTRRTKMSCSGEDMKDTKTQKITRMPVEHPISVECVMEYTDSDQEGKVRHPLGNDEEYAIRMVIHHADSHNYDDIRLLCITKLEQEISIPELT